MRSVLPFVISHPLFPLLLRNLQLTLVLLLPAKKVTWLTKKLLKLANVYLLVSVPSILRSGHSNSLVSVTKANWEKLFTNQRFKIKSDLCLFFLAHVYIPCNHLLSKYVGFVVSPLGSGKRYIGSSIEIFLGLKRFSYLESLSHMIQCLHICHINLHKKVNSFCLTF